MLANYLTRPRQDQLGAKSANWMIIYTDCQFVSNFIRVRLRLPFTSSRMHTKESREHVESIGVSQGPQQEEG